MRYGGGRACRRQGASTRHAVQGSVFRVQGLGFGLGKGAAHGMRGGTHLSTPENRRAASVHAAAVIRLSEHAVVCKEEVVAGAQLAPRRQSAAMIHRKSGANSKIQKIARPNTHSPAQRSRPGHGPVHTTQSHKVTQPELGHGEGGRPGPAGGQLRRTPQEDPRLTDGPGPVVRPCTSHPGVLGSIPKREEPGKTGAPCECFGCLLQTQMEHSLECPSL